MSTEALELLKKAAWKVRDPQAGRSLWEEGRVGNARIEKGRLHYQLVLDGRYDDKTARRLRDALESALREEGWQGPVEAEVLRKGAASSSKPKTLPGAQQPAVGLKTEAKGKPLDLKQPIPGVKHVVAVASGKGGVGKSTVAVQLAVGLKQLGYRVGILDADIHGPSLPTMLGLSGQPSVTQDKKIIPLKAKGLSCMSIGLLLGASTPVIWRGPLVANLVKQFMHDVLWGELDYLVVDLPPGTGDASLTMAQSAPVSGVVIVSTPQHLALLDVVRGVEMFRKLEIPVLGFVENMAWYPLPDGTRDYIFGEGGVQRVAEQYGVDLLAQVPLVTDIRVFGDTGRPEIVRDTPAGPAFEALARKVAEKLPV